MLLFLVELYIVAGWLVILAKLVLDTKASILLVLTDQAQLPQVVP